MRVLLVGSSEQRARLRRILDGSLQVVGEFSTLSGARQSALQADAVVMPALRATDTSSDLPHEALTPREIEVLELLAEGLSNKGIATRLRISDQTVKFHVASLAAKLGASNRTDTVRRAARRGLITL